MNMRQIAPALMAVLLTTSNVYAGQEKSSAQPSINNNGNHYAYGLYKDKSDHPTGGHSYVAPEIDAASGTSAIALLTGILLLAGERVQSKRKLLNARRDEA